MINKNKKEKIAVAMSGGVDSSFVAYTLKQEGYDIFGITMIHFDDDVCINSAKEAENIAKKLGIKHHTIDLRNSFKNDIIDYFTSSYKKGETPSPCIVCNLKIKFGKLLNEAEKLGADKIATGHYAKIKKTKDESIGLFKGCDLSRDQSYFLFGLTKEQLKKTIFPLNNYQKSEIREILKQANLTVYKKPDSQDVCFVKNNDYANLVCKTHPECENKGEIIDKQGNKLGEHKGYINYTIGQRKGLGIGGAEKPYYVIEIDDKKNRIIVGSKKDLKRNKIIIENLNLLVDDINEDEVFTFKFRSTQKGVDGTIKINENKQAVIKTKDFVYGIANGQAAVFYSKNRLIGGGWITDCGVF